MRERGPGAEEQPNKENFDSLTYGATVSRTPLVVVAEEGGTWKAGINMEEVRQSVGINMEERYIFIP